ncbi:PREDICTED: E3 ubiquitin-protein ligase Topors-like, partial [Ficedula albicollis]|uniref:E3 ubiquitin-protein ligase Topors-like n=1 Tax=Ficedula albicollis TaxID=59894 RepID=UPI000359ADF1
MATGTDSNCPICQETWDDMASALPCRHQFCLGCILRWATTNPSCPLCRTLIETVRFSERGEQDYVQFVITSPAEPAETSSQPERAPHHLDQNSLHGPVVSPAPSAQGTLIPAEQRPPEPEPVGGLLPEVWAGLFRQRQHLLEPVRPWLRRRLQGIFRDRWWLAEVAESSVLRELCLHGPDAAILVLRLRHYLEEHTAPLVRSLIGVIAGRCSKEAKRRLRSRDSGEDSGSSSSSCTGSRDRTPDRGPAGSGVQEEAGTSQSSLQDSHSCARPVPGPAERERPRRSRRGTGPSARGCV